jgi:hypothetical protein
VANVEQAARLLPSCSLPAPFLLPSCSPPPLAAPRRLVFLVQSFVRRHAWEVGLRNWGTGREARPTFLVMPHAQATFWRRGTAFVVRSDSSLEIWSQQSVGIFMAIFSAPTAPAKTLSYTFVTLPPP